MKMSQLTEVTLETTTVWRSKVLAINPDRPFYDQIVECAQVMKGDGPVLIRAKCDKCNKDHLIFIYEDGKLHDGPSVQSPGSSLLAFLASLNETPPDVIDIRRR